MQQTVQTQGKQSCDKVTHRYRNGGVTDGNNSWLITGARTLKTTGSDELEPVTVLVAEGKIRDLGQGESAARELAARARAATNTTPVNEVNLNGALLTPGLIDVHVHLREPGQETKETIASGTRAAARGGWTSVCAMPNTIPTPHTPELLANVHELIAQHAHVRVFPLSPITTDLHEGQLVDLRAQAAAGAIAFSNDGFGVQLAGTMLQAMEQAAALGLPIATHSEDESIKGAGVINAGATAKRLNLPGIDRLAEIVQVTRDAEIALATGAHLHLCHASTVEAVRIARTAQTNGANVTVEATPHHLLLNDELITRDDANWKVNPPLRAHADTQALINGLNDGTITVIATDNAPHLPQEKHCSFRAGAFGMVSNEYAFALLYTYLVRSEKISLRTLVNALTSGPAAAYNLPGGHLEIGAPADLAAFDLGKDVTITAANFVGKAQNSPFIGRTVKGDCIWSMCAGNVVHSGS